MISIINLESYKYNKKMKNDIKYLIS